MCAAQRRDVTGGLRFAMCNCQRTTGLEATVESNGRMVECCSRDANEEEALAK